jgi:hypothetical protein
MQMGIAGCSWWVPGCSWWVSGCSWWVPGCSGWVPGLTGVFGVGFQIFLVCSGFYNSKYENLRDHAEYKYPEIKQCYILYVYWHDFIRTLLSMHLNLLFQHSPVAFLKCLVSIQRNERHFVEDHQFPSYPSQLILFL